LLITASNCKTKLRRLRRDAVKEILRRVEDLVAYSIKRGEEEHDLDLLLKYGDGLWFCKSGVLNLQNVDFLFSSPYTDGLRENIKLFCWKRTKNILVINCK
jgi:hypothetical protein